MNKLYSQLLILIAGLLITGSQVAQATPLPGTGLPSDNFFNDDHILAGDYPDIRADDDWPWGEEEPGGPGGPGGGEETGGNGEVGLPIGEGGFTLLLSAMLYGFFIFRKAKGRKKAKTSNQD